MSTTMLDLDGVASAWVPTFYPWMCEKLGLVPTEWRIWHHYRNHELHDTEFVALLTEYAEQGGFAEQPVMDGAPQLVQALTEAGHSVHIVTDRPPAALADTSWWVDTHLPGYTSLTVSRDKTVFKEYGDPTYYGIDDRVENVETMRSAGIYAYLLDAPWNEDADLPRVRSLDEYVDKVLRRANS